MSILWRLPVGLLGLAVLVAAVPLIIAGGLLYLIVDLALDWDD